MHLRVKKEREKWRKDRDTGKKGINDLIERGKCAQRKKWREANKLLLLLFVNIYCGAGAICSPL